MSRSTLIRGFALLATLALTACATPPASQTTQSLLEHMAATPRATLASCGAANMALVCHSAAAGRTRSLSTDGRCSCADRNELAMSPWR